ncbi:hypothetical protein [Brucella pseudogrignonensis]|uniref:Uncharacterized protein n=1 Tax=Brucella pseudogrignonensis TaxID=419475 RepID=A0A256GW07_9HYPH|nr:hypothetical protein [Brucella pseudogrignonensis]OYR30926.1 hypothetical protein CEV34_0016 [Brucella pseudogrignonensis]
MKTLNLVIALAAATFISFTAGAADQLWVKIGAIERKTCPSDKCGTVGKLFFRESARILETQNGWGRVTRVYDASCSGGKSQYVDSGRAVCDKANGIVDGKFAEWIKLDGLSKERPAPAKAGNSAIEQALKDSDRYEDHKDRFIAAADALMTSGQCTLQDFIDEGGWMRSTQKSRGVGIYFTYCDGGSKRVYLDVNTGKVSTN